jgi:hypothetical protein
MKRKTQSYSDFLKTGILHLWLPSSVLAKMDEAMKSRPIRTREEFVLFAILWALDSVEANENQAAMGLEEGDDSGNDAGLLADDSA